MTTLKRKILYIEGSPYANYPADPKKNVGGSLISLYHLVKDLNEQEFNPSILLFYDSYLIDQIKGRHFQISVKPKKYRRGKTKKPVHIFFNRDYYSFLSYLKMTFLRMFPSMIRMYSFLKRERPDIVHCNNSLRLNMDAILASRLAGIPCVCHVRCYEKLYFINKLCAFYVKYFICISKAVRNNYIGQGIKKQKLIVIPNGLDIQDFPIPMRQHQVGKVLTITCIGRMTDWKGQEVLLKAIPLVTEKKKNLRFRFVGDGTERANLEKMASALNINWCVEFAGVVQDIQSILAISDLLVHTSTRPEPFGRVIIEAMSMQIPVIATNIGGPIEIISDGRDGILIEPNQPEQLAKTILMLLDDPERRQKIGKAARKTIEEFYDSKIVAEQVEMIYKKMLREKSSAIKSLN